MAPVCINNDKMDQTDINMMLITQVVAARKWDQLFLHVHLCLRCWCAAWFEQISHFRFNLKSWLNQRKKSCYQIKSESCCIAILHVNSLLIAIHSPLCTSAGAYATESFDCRGRGWAWWYGVSVLGSSDPLHSLCFFVWKAHCLCCAHLGKHFTKRRSWTQKRHLFVPSVPFILFPLLCTEA